MSSISIIPLVAFLLVLATRFVNPATLVSEELARWSEWKGMHQKSYADSYEENMRRAIWRYNLKKIKEQNKARRSFTLGLNKLSDLTSIEYQYLMLKKPKLGHNEKIRHVGLPEVARTLPASVDWRKRGCVTPVLNQGELGACWAFSAVGSLEGRHCVVTKQLATLDVTKLEDCCTSCHCVTDAFRYMIAHNHVDETLPRGNYNQAENCNFSKAAYGASMSAYTTLPFGSELSLQKAVADAGPVSVAIDASHQSFQLYAGGVYDEPSCSSTQLDHAVLVVGYGSLDGKDYWLVKNSWGTNWGMKGYIMMARNKDNQCGIASSAAYPSEVSVTQFVTENILW